MFIDNLCGPAIQRLEKMYAEAIASSLPAIRKGYPPRVAKFLSRFGTEPAFVYRISDALQHACRSHAALGLLYDHLNAARKAVEDLDRRLEVVDDDYLKIACEALTANVSREDFIERCKNSEKLSSYPADHLVRKSIFLESLQIGADLSRLEEDSAKAPWKLFRKKERKKDIEFDIAAKVQSIFEEGIRSYLSVIKKCIRSRHGDEGHENPNQEGTGSVFQLPGGKYVWAKAYTPELEKDLMERFLPIENKKLIYEMLADVKLEINAEYSQKGLSIKDRSSKFNLGVEFRSALFVGLNNYARNQAIHQLNEGSLPKTTSLMRKCGISVEPCAEGARVYLGGAIQTLTPESRMLDTTTNLVYLLRGMAEWDDISQELLKKVETDT